MTKHLKFLYKLVHYESGAVSWFTDSDELFHVMDLYGEEEYSVYKYELVEKW